MDSAYTDEQDCAKKNVLKTRKPGDRLDFSYGPCKLPLPEIKKGMEGQ